MTATETAAPAAPTCAYCGQALTYRRTVTGPLRQEKAWCASDGWGSICGAAPEGQHTHACEACSGRGSIMVETEAVDGRSLGYRDIDCPACS